MKKLRAGYRAQVAKKTKEIDQLVAESDEDEAIITLLDIIKQKWEYEDMVNLEILAFMYEEEQDEQESAKDERVLLSRRIDQHFRKVQAAEANRVFPGHQSHGYEGFENGSVALGSSPILHGPSAFDPLLHRPLDTAKRQSVDPTPAILDLNAG